MKKTIKEIVSCVLLGVLFAGVFMIGFSISCGAMTRLEGLALLVGGALLTICYALGIKEEK